MMKNNYYTFELALLYEEQGVYEKALEYYKALLKESPLKAELSDAVERVKGLLARQTEVTAKNRLSELFEEWVELLLIKQRYQFINSI
ncbi:MAG: hypothetical protein U9N77_08845 [Thermodesulfobacteriota bacterium]|nr:hypothetical protein [Thermodesulfobacteriota bacterium]